MNKFSLWVGLLLFSGCGLLSKTTQQNKSSEHASSAEKLLIRNKMDLESNVRVRDSSNTDYYLEIKPIGPFKFSGKDGFDGVAEYVRMKGKIMKTQVVNSAHRQNSSAAIALDKNQASAKSNSDQYSSKSSFKPSWIIIIALIGLILFWWWRRKFL